MRSRSSNRTASKMYPVVATAKGKYSNVIRGVTQNAVRKPK
jgi:hypothetical protein